MEDSPIDPEIVIEKEYTIPDPKINPASALVIIYKVSKGLKYDNRGWDKRNFSRTRMLAVELLEACGGYENAKKCIEEIGVKLDSIQFDWTLSTILNKSYEWAAKRGKRNDKQERQRLYDDYIKQRSSHANPGQGSLVTGGEIIGSLRNILPFTPRINPQERRGNSNDGVSGKGIRQDSVEAKEIGGHKGDSTDFGEGRDVAV